MGHWLPGSRGQGCCLHSAVHSSLGAPAPAAAAAAVAGPMAWPACCCLPAARLHRPDGDSKLWFGY